MDEINLLRDKLIIQNSKDEEFCVKLTHNVLSAIQSTKAIKDIKDSIQTQFYKYFAEAKKLFFRIHQIKIINTFQNKNLIENNIDSILTEDFFYVNIPLNYCERKAQKLSDVCRRIVFASSFPNEDDFINFKMMLFEFFSDIKIDIDLEKEDDNDIIGHMMKEGQFCQSNFFIFSSNP